MTKKKPCIVRIAHTNYADQPYVVTIDKPGRAEPYKLKQRYSTRWSAKRGALRNLRASYSRNNGCWFIVTTGEARRIKFVFTTSKRRK